MGTVDNQDEIRILYMEDNQGLALLFQRILTDKGYCVDIAVDGREGLEKYEMGSYDVLVLDHDMPEIDGLEVAKILAEKDALPPTIMVTGAGNESIAVEAMKIGVGDYIVKDVKNSFFDLIPAVIDRLLNQRRLEHEHKKAQEELKKTKDELEVRVRERTAELNKLNVDLKYELAERIRAESLLRESEQRLRHLSSRLMQTQEIERKRISGELHDSIGQSLTSIKMRLENVMRKKNHCDEVTLEMLSSTVELTGETIEEVRRIVMDLRPSTLDDLGLIATLNWFVREHQGGLEDMTVDMNISLQEEGIPQRLKIILFRFIQEAFNNAVKHSGADRISILLERKDEKLLLKMKDNGSGFDVDAFNASRRRYESMGLTSMRERIEFSGGRLHLDSKINEGTEISAEWTISESEITD